MDADKPESVADTIQPTDAISEAARKILRSQFEVMLKRAAKILNGDDDTDKIEAVHDMRVAIRRIRSAIRLLGMYYKKDSPLYRHRKTLKQVGIALGHVRDLQLFIASLDQFVKTLAAETTDSAEASDAAATAAPLPNASSDGWHSELGADLHQAEKTLEKLLKSHRYASMVADLTDFLNTPGVGAKAVEGPQSYQVRHVLPPLIYTDYSTVRAYETTLDDASLDTLHQLRIACKRLRYTLEFFAEVLDSDVQQVIDATKMMQDHLGQIQDAQVHRSLLEDYAKHAPDQQTMTLLLKYLEINEAAKDTLRLGIPGAWQSFTASAIRQALAMAISNL